MAQQIVYLLLLPMLARATTPGLDRYEVHDGAQEIFGLLIDKRHRFIAKRGLF
jgi:hypothetical protein